MSDLPARTATLLGQSVARLRHARGLTQAELARRADVSRQWLIALESAQRPGADLERLRRVLDQLDAHLAVVDERGEEDADAEAGTGGAPWS